jgi:hypothetical protein
MKKAKMILTAMTVLAVVGGALAFKARTTFTPIIYYTENGGGNCVIANTDLVSFTDDPTATPINASPVKLVNSPCPATFLTTAD